MGILNSKRNIGSTEQLSKSPDVFFISDTHFGHNNILKFEAKNRPFATIEEHNEALIENWNRVVKPNDKVYHLGDVVFGRNTMGLLARLNGHKRLVLGNHDTQPITEYLKYFEKVFGARVFDRYVLTHVPVHHSSFETRFDANIHGHTHSSYIMQTDAKWLRDEHYWNVSCEVIGLTPIHYEDLKKKYQ